MFSQIIGDGISCVKGNLSHIKSKTSGIRRTISRILPSSHENWEALCRIYDYHKREGVIVPVGLMRPIHQGASARTKSRVKLTLSSNDNGVWHEPTPWGYERYTALITEGDLDLKEMIIVSFCLFPLWAQ